MKSVFVFSRRYLKGPFTLCNLSQESLFKQSLETISWCKHKRNMQLCLKKLFQRDSEGSISLRHFCATFGQHQRKNIWNELSHPSYRHFAVKSGGKSGVYVMKLHSVNKNYFLRLAPRDLKKKSQEPSFIK